MEDEYDSIDERMITSRNCQRFHILNVSNQQFTQMCMISKWNHLIQLTQDKYFIIFIDELALIIFNI